jgi:hypothetical protein
MGGRQPDGEPPPPPELDLMLPHTKEAGLGDEIYRHTMDAYAYHWPAEEEWHVVDT